MGSEWSEEQAGPQGPSGSAGSPGSPGATGPAGAAGIMFADSNIGTGGGTRYNGSAQAMVTSAGVSGFLTAGERYLIMVHVPLIATVAGDSALVRVHAGTTVGDAVVGFGRLYLSVATVTHPLDFMVIHQAAATGSQSFGLSCVRSTGTGTLSISAAVGNPLFVTLCSMPSLSASSTVL